MDKKELQGYLNNENIQFFLYSILKYESGKVDGKVNIGGHNETSGNSSAFGSQQFIGDTRNEILKEYGVDAWSKNLEEQQLATLALLHRGNQLENASKGDYSNINDWEAFTEERRSRLDNRPENWLEEYNSLKSDSVYDPASSWARIPEEMKKQKKAIFDRKYSDVDFESITTNVYFENKAQNETYANISEKIDNSFYSDKEKQLLKEKLKKDLEGKTDVQDLTSLIENYNLEDEVLGIDGISTMKVDESISNMQTILDDPNATLKQKQEASEIINELKVKDLEINTYSPGSREEVNAINEKALSTEKAKEIFEKYKPKQDTKLLDKEEPKFFTGPDGKQYPYSKVEPGTEDTITTEGLLQQGQGPEVDLSSAKGLDVIAPSYETPEKTPLGQKIKNFFKEDGDGEGLKNALSSLKNSADEAFFALSAGAGIMSVYEATRRDKVTKSHVDPLFKEALLKTREAAQTGMPYEQRQAALKDIANSYSGAMKNVMAISGGQRGAALANIGAVDSTRVNALVDLASKSADMRQKNLDLYSKTAAAYSSQKLNADMTHEQLKQKVEMNRKNNLRAIGLNLFKEATEFSRNYMDISGIEGSSNQTSIIPEDNISSEVVSDELSDNLGFTN